MKVSFYTTSVLSNIPFLLTGVGGGAISDDGSDGQVLPRFNLGEGDNSTNGI